MSRHMVRALQEQLKWEVGLLGREKNLMLEWPQQARASSLR